MREVVCVRDIKSKKHPKVNKFSAVLKKPSYSDFRGETKIYSIFSSEDLIRPNWDDKLCCMGLCLTDSSVCGYFGTPFCKNCPYRG